MVSSISFYERINAYYQQYDISIEGEVVVEGGGGIYRVARLAYGVLEAGSDILRMVCMPNWHSEKKNDK